eukprot:TRINITY_DN2666_c0_g1_i1.p1 TRINITY_DN2666_c0_g1~~TRINITY_DN2666_c0_g1_i1.p1  ORF type:complete len:122 (+),score=10.06 TRINITY_DN2666_c0_g1_i1:25-366(+)
MMDELTIDPNQSMVHHHHPNAYHHPHFDPLYHHIHNTHNPMAFDTFQQYPTYHSLHLLGSLMTINISDYMLPNAVVLSLESVYVFYLHLSFCVFSYFSCKLCCFIIYIRISSF